MPGGGAGCFFKYALECSGRMNQLIKGERGRIMLEGECSPATTCEWLDRVCWIMQNCFKLANTAQISQVLVRNRGCSKRPTVHPPSPCTPRGRPACAKPLRRRQGTPLADPAPSRGHAFSTALDKEQWPCWPFPGSDRLLMVSPDIILWVKGGQRLLSWLKLERFRFCDTTFYFLLYLIDLLPRFLNGFVTSMKSGQGRTEFPCFSRVKPKLWVLVIGLWGVLGGCASIEGVRQSNPTGLELGCATGDVTPNEATIWLKASGSESIQVQYGIDSPSKRMISTSPISPTPDSNFTVKINLSGLTPKTRYVYRAVVERKQPGPLCQFVTAPSLDDFAQVVFVIGGDVRASFRPFTIMNEMRSANPDFFLFVGDTIYSDKGKAAEKLADYWGKYWENRDPATQGFLAKTSVYVMWDDHEVDSDFISTHPRMPVGRQAFFDYWPIRQNSEDPYRLYRVFQWGQAVEFFLLDTRQYRDPSTHTMLGEVQKHWLMDRLNASLAKVKFIVTSVPISDPGKDKWGEYNEERDEILDYIGKQGITGVVFLATDVHHAAIAKVPGPLGLKELIFGPLAAPMNYWIDPQEPRFEYFHDQYQNYGKITVRPQESAPLLEVEWYGEDHRLLHRLVLESDASGNLVSLTSEQSLGPR